MLRIAHVSDLHVLSPVGVEWQRILFNKRITGYANLLMKRGRVYRADHLLLVLEGAAERAGAAVRRERRCRGGAAQRAGADSRAPGGREAYARGAGSSPAAQVAAPASHADGRARRCGRALERAVAGRAGARPLWSRARAL